MKLLDGRDVAGFIQERHARAIRSLGRPPRLVIVRSGDDEATSRYLRAKQRYGEAIGAEVLVHQAAAATILGDIKRLSSDATGLIVQLPLLDPTQTEAALAAVPLQRDIDGLAPNSPFEATTPKAIMWLLAAYNVDLAGRRIAVVGQGRLVGRPLADRLELAGHEVVRCDEHTPNLAAVISAANIVITATGQPGLITSAMLQRGAVVVDAASPQSDLADDVLTRADLTRSPNPGGVGTMTVAALYDNLLIAAGA